MNLYVVTVFRLLAANLGLSTVFRSIGPLETKRLYLFDFLELLKPLIVM